MPKPSLLIFDLDGTLIDSVPDIADAVNYAMQQLGYQNFSENQIRHWVGNGATVLLERALSASHTTALTPKTLEQALHLFFHHYQKQTCLKTIPYANVHKGLQNLAEHFTLALITNKPKQFIAPILQHFGWQDLFAHTLGGDSLAVKKPHPEPLWHTAEKLGFLPEQAIMIGDSKNDVLAGKNANMMTLALSYGYNYGQDIGDFSPDHTFDDFQDLVDFLLTYS